MVQFETGMTAELCKYCAINFAEDTVLFLLYLIVYIYIYDLQPLQVNLLRGMERSDCYQSEQNND